MISSWRHYDLEEEITVHDVVFFMSFRAVAVGTHLAICSSVCRFERFKLLMRENSASSLYAGQALLLSSSSRGISEVTK
jgi:hypothetical protein